MICRVCRQKVKFCEVCRILHHVLKDESADFILDMDHDAVEDTDNLDRQERSNETKGGAE